MVASVTGRRDGDGEGDREDSELGMMTTLRI